MQFVILGQPGESHQRRDWLISFFFLEETNSDAKQEEIVMAKYTMIVTEEDERYANKEKGLSFFAENPWEDV